MFSDLSWEEQFLLLGSTLHISSPDLLRLEQISQNISDWDSVLTKAQSTALAALIFKNCTRFSDQNLLPNQVVKTLKANYYRYLSSNIRLYNDFTHAAKVLQQEGLDFIPLKGIMLLDVLYVDYGLRITNDIDLLVRAQDVERVKNVLLNNEWKLVLTHPKKSEFFERQEIFHHPYCLIKNNSVIELHRHVHSSFSHFNINIDDYWSRSVFCAFSGVNGRNFCVEDLLQHLCTHQYTHLISGQFRFSSFNDIVEMLLLHRDQIDWHLLYASSVQYNCLKELQQIMFLCQSYWNSNVPPFFFDGIASPINELESVFLCALNGDQFGVQKALAKVQYQISNVIILSSFSGWKSKLRYVVDDVFPQKSYMVARYKMRYTFLLPIYYLWRIWIGLSKIVLKFTFSKA